MKLLVLPGDGIGPEIVGAAVHVLNAADANKKLELVQAKNQGDGMVHSVRKSLTEYGDKLADDEKSKIEAAMKEAEEAIKSGDKDSIEAKSQALAMAAQKLGEQMYAQAQAEGGGQPGAGAGGQQAGGKADDADVVDAEFTEVKDKK